MRPHLVMALLAFAVAAYAFYLAFARSAEQAEPTKLELDEGEG